MDLEDLKKAVFARRPVLGDIADRFSGSLLKNYVQDQWQAPTREPENVFLDLIKGEAKNIFGADLADKIAGQLFKKPAVSTVDHHGIWNHPIFVNSSLIYSLHFEAGDVVPVLATESVSLNNSCWPASLLYHHKGQLKRHGLLPDRLKGLPVFSAPAITAVDVDRFRNNTKGRLDSLLTVLDIANASAKSFSTQACIISYNFWQAVFPSAPKLIYLPLETIVGKYLLRILQDDGHFLSQLILTKEGRLLWQKYFGQEHTFMFWEIDEQGRRQAVTSLPEKQSEILKLMENRKLYASSPLCFVVLLKAGLACVGGFTQTSWLTEAKEKLKLLLKDLGNVDQSIVDNISNIPTQNFAESSLARLNIDGKYVEPSAVDLFLTGKDYYPKYKSLAEKLTLGQSFNLAMVGIYKIVVPKAEQMSKSAIDEIQIQSLTQLEELL